MTMEFILSFLLTWIVILTPPLILRAANRGPVGRTASIVTCGVLYFANFVIFTALGSTSKSHLAILLGAWLSYKLLVWQTAKAARAEIAAQRKAMGYDEPAA
jgi:hypothetical protein